jgi:tight adherence protein C
MSFDLFASTISVYQVIVGFATVIAFMVGGSIYLERMSFEDRMKSVVTERNRMRGKAREEMATSRNNVRPQAKPFMKQIVDSFNLSTWLGTQDSKLQLARAGYRGPQAEIGFLFFRLLMPGVMGVIAILYVFVLQVVDVETMTGFAIVFAAAFLGLKIPEIYLSNTIAKRQASLRSAFPDAHDLLLICVESGMSIEAAMRKVAQEIGVQSVALAEEFGLTMAELSYLPDRKQAYENFAIRTDIDASKQIAN